MATYTTTTTYFCDTDAEFRALITIVLAALSNCGWTQTADTGQVNTATVTYPAGNNNDATNGSWLGYMDDALHGSAPIYMKLTFGRGNAAGSFRVVITFSMTGTNGTGSLLNGTPTSGATYNFSAPPSTRLVTDATLYNVYASGDDGRFGLAWCVDAPAAPYGRMFTVERFRNSDGTPSANGFAFSWHYFNGDGNAANTNGITFLTGGPVPTVEVAGDHHHGYSTATDNHFGNTPRTTADSFSTLKAGKVYAFPSYPSTPGEKYPFLQVLTCALNDFPLSGNVSLTLYGGAKTYKCLGRFATDPLNIQGAASNVAALFLYE